MIPAPTHHDLSHMYGCPATMTVAYFTYAGIPHVARRFYRADAPATGKIELYTKCPSEGFSTWGEDWLGYAKPGTAVGRKAAEAIESAVTGPLGEAISARFAAIEF